MKDLELSREHGGGGSDMTATRRSRRTVKTTSRRSPLTAAATKEFRGRLARARHRLVIGTRPGGTADDRALLVQDRPTWAAAMATLSRLGRRGRRLLEEITAAEQRLDAGVFGLCERCQQPIAPSRLRAAPTLRRCARCRAKRGQRRR
jgi:DnaK suppressor protein